MTTYFLCDFNVGVENASKNIFVEVAISPAWQISLHVKKNPDRPSCIDLILTNYTRSFQNLCAVETWSPDFHKVVVTVMKTTYSKLEPRIVHYRDFKYLCNCSFKESLQKTISQNWGVGCDEIYECFAASSSKTLDNNVHLKKEYVRGNHSSFINKSLSKAIMVKTKLRNIFLKNRCEENKINYACCTFEKK